MSEFDVIGAEDELFAARPYLKAVQRAAHDRMCAPSAVLGAVLARTLVLVSPSVLLPALRGGPAALNLIVGTAGLSGTSKTSGGKVAGELLPLCPSEIPVRGLGSGEGLITAYFDAAVLDAVHASATSHGLANDGLPAHIPAVLFTVDELGELLELTSRSGATLLPRLRTAFSGGTLGGAFAGEGKGRHLHDNTYRCCVTLGVQPGLCGKLFSVSAIAAGTPQRLLWTWATDERISQMDDDLFAVSAIKPLELPTLDLAEARACWERGSPQIITVPDEAIAAVRADARARHRGDWDGDPLDSHALLIQLKVAAALAVLDGRLLTITSADWHLADIVMSCSRHWRGRVLNELRATQVHDHRATGEERGEIAAEAEVAKWNHSRSAIERVAAQVLKKLPANGVWVSKRWIKAEIVASRDRWCLDEVFKEISAQIEFNADGELRLLPPLEGSV